MEATQEAQSTTTTSGETEEMLSLTAKAAEKVREIMAAEKDIPKDYGLRLRVVGGGCSGFAYDLYFDGVQATDRQFESHGVKLVVDPMSLQYLAGTQVDYVEG